MPDIRAIDPHDFTALDAWHTAVREGSAVDGHTPLVDPLPEYRAVLTDPAPRVRADAFAAVEDGEVVGALDVRTPLYENTHLTSVEIAVPPRHRRRGVGSALLDHARRLAAGGGRTTMTACAVVPVGTPLGDSPGGAFARRNGFTGALCEDRFVLDLPVPDDRLDTVAAGAHPERHGLSIVSWTGPCPDPYLDAMAALHTAMERDVPTGDLDVAPVVWDPARVREEDDRMTARGCTTLTSAVRDGDGRFWGYTAITVSEHWSEDAFQEDTLVLPEQRGRRLGAALKAHNLRALLREHPDRKRVHTWNAEVNGPMRAINAALGFVSVEKSHELQWTAPGPATAR
jgi:GNAT superfamily N-acetyltransferase